MRNERGDFQPEQLPQARVHFAVSGLPLLPCAQLAMHQLGGSSLAQPCGVTGGADFFGRWAAHARPGA